MIIYRHFALVVSVHAYTQNGHYPVISHVSERIIVRVSVFVCSVVCTVSHIVFYSPARRQILGTLIMTWTVVGHEVSRLIQYVTL